MRPTDELGGAALAYPNLCYRVLSPGPHNELLVLRGATWFHAPMDPTSDLAVRPLEPIP
jgi:hypothetical protein